jgi:hypothetical protein
MNRHGYSLNEEIVALEGYVQTLNPCNPASPSERYEFEDSMRELSELRARRDLESARQYRRVTGRNEIRR